MDRDSIRAAAAKVMDKLFASITILMAIAMMAYSAAEIYQSIDVIGAVRCAVFYGIPFVCGLLIILDRHRSVFFAVGMFAISIGFSRFIRYGEAVITNSGSSPTDVILFYGQLILTVLALNMMYSGYRYMHRNSRSITYIILSALLFAAILLGEILNGFRSFTDPVLFFEHYIKSIARFFMYLVYVGLVWSEAVRKSTDLARMEDSLAALRIDVNVGPDMSMRKEAADRFVGFVRGEVPGDLPVSGPVVSRTAVRANDGMVWVLCNLERWSDGGIYMTVSRSDSGSQIDPTVFPVKEASFEEGSIVVRYRGGRTGRFRIRERYEDDIAVKGAFE